MHLVCTATRLAADHADGPANHAQRSGFCTPVFALEFAGECRVTLAAHVPIILL